MNEPKLEEDSNASEPSRRESCSKFRGRWLLVKIGVLFNALVGVAIAVPVVKYLLSPVTARPDLQVVGLARRARHFPVGETRLATFTNPSRQPMGRNDRWRRLLGSAHRDRQFQVFAINCAHLGCPVRWFPQSQLFMCPCHGGAYYADGSRASGPPERGLFTYRLAGSHGGAIARSTRANCRLSRPPPNSVSSQGCAGRTPCAG